MRCNSQPWPTEQEIYFLGLIIFQTVSGGAVCSKNVISGTFTIATSAQS